MFEKNGDGAHYGFMETQQRPSTLLIIDDDEADLASAAE